MEKEVSQVQFRTYTGTKTIKAAPMGANDARRYGAAITEETVKNNIGNDGYLVQYPDGYRSWFPKKVFDEAYRLDETLLDSMKNELADLVNHINEATTLHYDVSGNFNCTSYARLYAQINGMRQYASMLYMRIVAEEKRLSDLQKEQLNNGAVD